MRADAFFQFSDSDARFSPAGAKSPLKIVRWPGMSHDSPGRWNKEISLYIVASVRRQLFLDTQFLLLQTCRSEEHTSELQSLMRISYAVFCLKKKTIKKKHTN